MAVGMNARRWLTAVVVLALVLVLGGVAWAAIPHSSTGVITGCYSNANGSLRVIDAEAGATCSGNETAVMWPSEKGFSGYEIVLAGTVVPVGGGPTVSVEAACPIGKVAVGGGTQIPGDPDPNTVWVLQYDMPIPFQGAAVGWVGQARRIAGETTGNSSIAVRVICAAAADDPRQ